MRVIVRASERARDLNEREGVSARARARARGSALLSIPALPPSAPGPTTDWLVEPRERASKRARAFWSTVAAAVGIADARTDGRDGGRMDDAIAGGRSEKGRGVRAIFLSIVFHTEK